MTDVQPIAIVGEGCLLPGAATPDELWQLVERGGCSLREPPQNHWRVPMEAVLNLNGKGVYKPGHSWCSKGGYVCNFDGLLDASGFAEKIPHIHSLDPLVQWSLYAGQQALNGVHRGTDPSRCGLILGNLSYPSSSLSRYGEDIWLQHLGAAPSTTPVHPINRFMSGASPQLIADGLDIKGRVFALDAACASGLYGVHIACEKLRDGQLDMVLAGAVNCTDPLFIHVGFCALGAMSQTAQSRPFHRDADGLIPAEGAAFVTLKRLNDALQDGDPILGLIRGSGLSNDGRAGGFLSPASAGQVRAMKAAYVQGGIDPTTISYVECHATGTQRGDQTELASMAEVFSQPLAISSLKANLGHSITTSAVAGIIKVLHCLKHRTIPTTPHAYPLANYVSASPYYVPEVKQNWEAAGPLRAAVNAFGFGGNNAHLILEEWQEQVPPAPFPKTNTPNQDVCVVACALKTHRFPDIAAVMQSLEDEAAAYKQLDFAAIDIKASGFPPLDLKASLGQQLLMLEVAQQAAQNLKLEGEGFGIFIGMGVDPEVCRYGLRTRLAAELGLTDDQLSSIAPELQAQHVLGTMPNVVANRISNAFDAHGQSFTLSSEDASGLCSLELAIRAIQTGDLDSALVGAVDMGREKVAQAATQALLGITNTADAATCLILKSRRQAELDGDQILGVLETGQKPQDKTITPISWEGIGYCHAASHLIGLVLAVRLASHGLAWNQEGLHPLLLNQEAGIHLDLSTWLSQSYQFRFVPNIVSPRPLLQEKQVFMERYQGENLQQLEAALHKQNQGCGPYRLAIWGLAADRPKRLAQAKQFLTTNPTKQVILKGLAFSPNPMDGDIAFLYTGAATAYPKMGKNLLTAYPQVLRDLTSKVPDAGSRFAWMYDGTTPEGGHAYQQLLGSSFLCQVHSIISRKLLGIKPDAIGGLSSGETNSLLAHDIWDQLPQLLNEVYASGLYQSELSGRYEAVKKYWQIDSNDSVLWGNVRVLVPLNTMENLLQGTERVYISMIHSMRDLVISGYRPELDRVLAQLPKTSYRELDHDLAIHCPPVAAFRDEWRKIHTRPENKVEGLRVYSNYFKSSYTPSSETIASALTGQALETVDFPALVDKMWQDGIRIFLEHGPRQTLGDAIKAVLKGRDFLAVSYDSVDSPDIFGVLKVNAALWTVGVEQDLSWMETLQQVHDTKSPHPTMNFPLHLPTPVSLPESAREVLKHKDRCSSAGIQESTKTHNDSSRRPQSQYPGPKLSRDDLKILAGGLISDIFGPSFQGQDAYPVQVRMPEPPLLLCDRVLGIEGAPKSMGKGRIWTETDVWNDSWYLVNGRMPAGLFIEAGQADLLLISWLGIDFHNQGERAYRLLGCELQFHGPLPKAGDQLSYDIQVDGHARHGDVRLFFFHYQCTIAGELRMSVRSGQAGFFSPDELAASEGVLWHPSDATYCPQPRLLSLAAASSKTALNPQELEMLRQGRLADCLGEQFRYTETHTRTPTIAKGPLQFIEAVESLDFKGGPKGRGYLCGVKPISPHDWFFKGHFKNDPCMPGTLMAEACLEAMSIYMIASGVTIKKDAWRFEPIPHRKYLFKCRGQVTPQSRYLRYEIFVEEFYVHEGLPHLVAHVLCTVDDRKAFLCESLGLRLVPDYPLSTMPNEEEMPDKFEGTIATLGQFPFNYTALLHSAWGHPKKAFGPNFPFEDHRRCPRLPGPPYHFISRVLSVDDCFLQKRSGGSVRVAYDLDPQAWYIHDSHNSSLPLAVLMEVALQPCGWLASFSGLPANQQQDLLFRNLDGEGVLHRPISLDDRTIETEAKLLSIANLGATTIVKFQVSCYCLDELVFQAETAFGYFAEETMIQQKGLGISHQEQQQVQGPHKNSFPMTETPVAGGKLKMIDRVTCFDPKGGPHSLGYIRGQKQVQPSDWFFKAHFFQDPVQPGSLGMEAMGQLLQCFVLRLLGNPAPQSVQFDVIAPQEVLEWHYRGQVTPAVTDIIVDVEISSLQQQQDDLLIHGIGRLWVQDTKIYEAPRMAIKARSVHI